MVERPRRGTVSWDDSHGGTESLDHPDIDRQHQGYRVETTGFILRDDEAGVSLVHSWNPPAEGLKKWDYREMHFIPRGMITGTQYWDAE